MLSFVAKVYIILVIKMKELNTFLPVDNFVTLSLVPGVKDIFLFFLNDDFRDGSVISVPLLC